MSQAQIDTHFSSVRALIQAELTAQALPSLAVAVAHRGQIIWEEAFGWADRESRVPATPHTLYSLASISKPITATGLMVLRERGLLDLDRPIDDYLGAAKLTARVGAARAATVRLVAGHMAGLPTHYQFFYADEPARPPAMDETIRRYANLISTPGERFQYSNLGYGLLDYVIALASGQSYADFMRQSVFLPLGMTHAAVGLPAELAPFAATRYSSDGLRYPFYDFDHPGGSAVFCSAHDLVRFGMFHLKAHLPDQQAILSDAAIDAMQQLPVGLEDRTKYALGWATNPDNGGYRSIGHSGGMGGVNTQLLLVPSEQLAVAVLVNANTPLPMRVAEAVLAALLPHYAAPAIAQAEESTAPAFMPAHELLGAWSGDVRSYAGDLPLRLWFQPDGDIHAQLGAQLRTLVNDARLEDGYLCGRMLGDLDLPDANRRPYQIQLELKLRGDTLCGGIWAIPSDKSDGSTLSRRLGNALCQWAELQKRAEG